MTFSDPKSVDNVLAAGSHELDGKKVSLFLGYASPCVAATSYYYAFLLLLLLLPIEQLK